MSYVSLGRFSLKDEPGMGPCWTPPVGVTALIDLVPPALDAEPDVNFAVMLSDAPLDSNDCHHSFGEGNVTEMQMTGAARDAWEAVTGYWPRSGTIGNCVAEHLLRSPGQDRANPLTCGKNRGLEVHLGERIWSHTLTGLSDPMALPVLQIEAEGLATIFREQGEQQYRLAMGGLRKWYKTTSPIRDLIQFIFPNGRDDLPLLDELSPNTVITETFPSTGNITTGQDNTWSMVVGANIIQVSPAGTLTQNASATEYTALLGYTFGGSNRSATWVQGSTTNAGGAFTRANATLQNAYLAGNVDNTSVAQWKRIVGAYTRLITVPSAVATGNTMFASVIGSTLLVKVNGVQIDSRTDTAVASGTRSGVRLFQVALTAGLVGPLEYDDLISGGGGGGGNSFLNLLLTGVG